MRKIPSIKELEDELLKNSILDDIHGGKPDVHIPGKHLTADDVRHDISVLARYLIRVYVGWPVHDDIVKRRVLTRLTRMYKSAHDMTTDELFESMKSVIGPIPDGHIAIFFNKVRSGTKGRRPLKDVGRNFADITPVKTELRQDGIAVIGVLKPMNTDEFGAVIHDFQNNIIPKSKALIVDMRRNGGGNSRYVDDFAKFLCGTWVDYEKKVFVRTTPEAQKATQEYRPDVPWLDIATSEKLQLWEKGTHFKINKKNAYMKPIFILTDARSGSTAERFLLRMIHHPMVTVIGDNSAGMEVYGNVCYGFLPHSNITVSVGMNYRILEYDNFELRGYKPHIKCKEGTNAMDLAIDTFVKGKFIKAMPHTNNFIKSS
ncbi:MAG: S41 family peptidase [Alphaproteobacteria bacterium]|nr:S41 family peptidase [Alphaproteobacteria bacterium]